VRDAADGQAPRRKRSQVADHGRDRQAQGQLYVNPLIDWTDEDMRCYRAEHKLPESDAAALLHRSGECNCGSFAKPGEREMLRSLAPRWFEATIGRLEREAKAAGIAACRWGQRPAAPSTESGPLCSTCEWRDTDHRSEDSAVPDLLETIRKEIDARRDELRPHVREAASLEAALRALSGA
jgi:3'-phosphoadenosine 5'-phosphosulfate sulfotransferase (PAPS reductase)/FAD synthetase